MKLLVMFSLFLGCGLFVGCGPSAPTPVEVPESEDPAANMPEDAVEAEQAIPDPGE